MIFMIEKDTYYAPSAELLPFSPEGMLCDSGEGTGEKYGGSSDYDGKDLWD